MMEAPGERAAAPRSGSSATVDKRARILAVARRRFAEHGFEATTVRQIADDIQMLAGSLYYHFVSKETMLHEIVDDAAEEFAARAETIAAGAGDAEQRLAALVSSDVHCMAARPETFAILHQERAFFRKSGDFAYVIAKRRRHYLAWGRVLSAGIAAGLFKPTPAEHLTVTTIIRMLNTGADWYAHADSHSPAQSEIGSLDDLIAFHTDFVLHAVRDPSRAHLPAPGPIGGPATPVS